MRIRKIGTTLFDSSTNVVVEATSQEAPGIGFRVNNLYEPQPFSAEIIFRRQTRQWVLDAVNRFARDLYSYSQRRNEFYPARAGGVDVVIEDADGFDTQVSNLRNANLTLLSIEPAADGVVARVRLTGTLVFPFIQHTYSPPLTQVTNLKPYERRTVSLNVGTGDAYLYKSNISYTTFGLSGARNALLAIEEREGTAGVSRIIVCNISSTTGGGIDTQNWNPGSGQLTRAVFSSTTTGVITYTVGSAVPQDVYRLFVEIFCPSTPPPNARYTVSWDGQPSISESISSGLSWYMPTLFVRSGGSVLVSLNVLNVPLGTMVMPIVLIPTDGVFVWNVITPPTLQSFAVRDIQTATASPFNTDPSGTIYGSPCIITTRNITVFNGIMAQTINNASVDLNFVSRRIEPAAFA
jgi:hypothetical protein